MAATTQVMRLPGMGAVVRCLTLARALLAVLGLAAVLTLGLPEPRQTLLEQLSALAHAGEAQAGNVAAGPIHPGAADASQARDQRAVAEFIARRYRVAQDAVGGFVASAYRAGSEHKVDPLLILAVMAIESRYNPVAESVLGARGLMQVIPRFHLEKLIDHGGESALLDPEVNITVGAQILREYQRRYGDTETALQMYAGAFDEPTSQYAGKVITERARLEQIVARARRSA